MRRSWVVVGSVLLASAPARATAPELRWAGPECSSFQAAFETKLASLITPAERATLSGAVSVDRRGDKLAVALALELGGTALGARRIEVKSCAAAADTAAVAASLAVFSAAEARVEPPAPAGVAAAVAAPPAATPAPAPVPTTRVERGPALEVRAGLLAAVDRGALPAVASGAAAELAVGIGRLSVGLIGGVSLAQRHDVDAAGRVRLQLWSASAHGCYAAYAGSRLRTDLCAGARLLHTRGRGEGFDVDREGSLFALAPLLAGGVSLRAPASLEWRLELDAGAPLSRQRFVVRSREVARLDPVVLGARLGVLVRF